MLAVQGEGTLKPRANLRRGAARRREFYYTSYQDSIAEDDSQRIQSAHSKSEIDFKDSFLIKCYQGAFLFKSSNGETKKWHQNNR
jgi:hypothetical protein